MPAYQGARRAMILNAGRFAAPPPVLPLTLFESFDALGPLSVSGPATMTLDTVGKFEGAGQVVLRGSGAGTGPVRIIRPGSPVDIDPQTSRPIVIRHDFGEDPEYHTFSPATAVLYDGSTEWVLVAQDSGFDPGAMGVRYQILDPRFNNAATPVPLTRKPYQFRTLTAAQGHAGGFHKVDAAAFYKAPKGKICLFLDDMRGTHVQIVLEEMRLRGLKGAVVFVVPSLMTGSNMRVADLHTLDDYGFEMAVGGTIDDGSLVLKASRADIVAGWNQLRNFITSEGFKNPGLNHSVYPNGEMVVPAPEVVLSGVQSNGSDILTVSSTANIQVGYRTASFFVPQNPFTLVKEILSATQVRVWDGINPVAVPAGTSLTLFRDISTEFGYGKLWKLHKDNGFTFARTAGVPKVGHFMDFEGGGLGRRLQWPNLSISNNYPVATMLQNVEDCERNGTFLGIVLHAIKSNDIETATDAGLTKLRVLLDRVKLGVDRGTMESVTLNDAEARYFNKTMLAA